MNIKPYEHHVHYYETDKMGVVHHSNFIRWMEEARVYLMSEIGFSYKRLEQEGIISPVIGVECDYKVMVNFDDTVLIDVSEEFYNGIKMTIKYTMTNKERQSTRSPLLILVFSKWAIVCLIQVSIYTKIRTYRSTELINGQRNPCTI